MHVSSPRVGSRELTPAGGDRLASVGRAALPTPARWLARSTCRLALTGILTCRLRLTPHCRCG